MTMKLLTIILTLSILCLTCCSKSVTPTGSLFLRQHLGQTCVVHFRRDALGAGDIFPLEFASIRKNSAIVSDQGKLVAVDSEGIVMEGTTEHGGSNCNFWIPYHAILTVIFQRDK